MGWGRRWLIGAGVALVLWQPAGPALAQEAKASNAAVPKTEEEGTPGKMLKKAIRGGQNLVFGIVTDVPRTVYYESREHGALYGVPIGLFKGIGVGAIRTAVGLYELLTFPLPVNDYEPLVQPEFPFEPGPTEAFPDTP